MADDQPDITQEPEDEILLNKIDSMLRRHRQEQSSLMQPVEQIIVSSFDSLEQLPSVSGELPGDIAESAPDIDGIPVLTDQVTLTIDEWPSPTEISELLYFAFDAALREACISLNPAERLTLIQALGKRLPKNI
ncbi:MULTISPECIES: hypothetical protein [Nitrosomonas]|uniref:Uncharacterized protein n=2 Tax=Nitrosomonas eutropha TaxID=916 RepID=A0ABX5M6A0_9PROT|nr:hypothetical protein [Nitrosomonas eutropha]MXS79767.1 hypothetical protein [Nitrosomonas sp. GH22]ABI58873.1 conserved hypothetical protein [Nitrosomonas eutropha C91]PXV80545.1 hypothetical protein C8R14_11626 [Nitrosomonas eutropha]SCX04713.1 hypothetical protein SAMN05216379_10348 [Nitrosomonas eutropha]SDW46305.1 hypothetical protein SAMN05216317_10649 [Nitrosomonas eutropha]